MRILNNNREAKRNKTTLAVHLSKESEMLVYALKSNKEKLSALPRQVHQALLDPTVFADQFHNGVDLGRDIEVLPPEKHPDKKGLSFVEGQARLLHDLGNIELQAMELAFRTLCEYPEAPQEFREQLAELTLSEGQHFQLCLKGLSELGYEWGHWPIHRVLWDCVSSRDSLLDRILIVHRYLEGSGLDAGATLVRRLDGVPKKITHEVVGTINREEVDHVAFGSRWYVKICNDLRLDPDQDFKNRFSKLQSQLPKRIENINRELRLKAGFTDSEIQFLEQKRQEFSKH